MNKVSARHFSSFRKSALHYLDLFGITGWSVEFHHAPSTDSMASAVIQMDGRRADIYLATEWEDEPTPQRVRESAKHEVAHIFAARLSSLASKRFVTADELYEAEEEMVAKLTKIVKG